MKRFYFLFSLFFISTFTHAGELEFALSEDLIEASYQSFYAGSFSSTVSWLHTDIENADFFKSKVDQKSDMIGLSLFANSKSGRFRSHLGGKAFWLLHDVNSKSYNMHGIALGGAADFYIFPKFFIRGNVLYAPDILTGGDFENYLELGARAGYQLLPNAVIFIGYRYLEIELNDVDADVYKGGLLGFNFNI